MKTIKHALPKSPLEVIGYSFNFIQDNFKLLFKTIGVITIVALIIAITLGIQSQYVGMDINLVDIKRIKEIGINNYYHSMWLFILIIISFHSLMISLTNSFLKLFYSDKEKINIKSLLLLSFNKYAEVFIMIIIESLIIVITAFFFLGMKSILNIDTFSSFFILLSALLSFWIFLSVALSYTFLIIEDVNIFSAIIKSFVAVNQKLWKTFILFLVISILMVAFSSLISAPILFSSINKSLTIVNNELIINNNLTDRLVIISISLFAYIPYYFNYFSISFWYCANINTSIIRENKYEFEISQ